MKLNNAPIVELNLVQTSMTRLERAANPVPQSCDGPKGRLAKVKSITYIGKHDVYNMEVKDHHNFSVNGGLIVHNCSDAERYGLYTMRYLANAAKQRNIKIPKAGRL